MWQDNTSAIFSGTNHVLKVHCIFIEWHMKQYRYKHQTRTKKCSGLP